MYEVRLAAFQKVPSGDVGFSRSLNQRFDNSVLPKQDLKLATENNVAELTYYSKHWLLHLLVRSYRVVDIPTRFVQLHQPADHPRAEHKRSEH